MKSQKLVNGVRISKTRNIKQTKANGTKRYCLNIVSDINECIMTHGRLTILKPINNLISAGIRCAFKVKKWACSWMKTSKNFDIMNKDKLIAKCEREIRYKFDNIVRETTQAIVRNMSKYAAILSSCRGIVSLIENESGEASQPPIITSFLFGTGFALGAYLTMLLPWNCTAFLIIFTLGAGFASLLIKIEKDYKNAMALFFFSAAGGILLDWSILKMIC